MSEVENEQPSVVELHKRVSDLNDWAAALERRLAEIEKAVGINRRAPTADALRREADALGR